MGEKCILFKRIFCFILLGCALGIFSVQTIWAKEPRTVKVAFFPMDGYHIVEADGSYGGMDVEYLKALCEYTDWQIEYVECESWGEALQLLDQHNVDLVGSAQYSKERAEIYDYADLASGYTFGVIATNASGNIAYEDFSAMQDITFGMVKNYVRKEEFLQYLADNHVTEPKMIEYDTTQMLQDALDAGEVDALVHTFMEVEEGQCLIGRFAPRPTYYITYKGNNDILRELNNAIVDLKMSRSELETDLMNKFYESRFDRAVLLTTEEKAYVEQTKQLVVGYFDGYYPFSYEEGGEFKGLSREVLESGFQVTGIELVYQRVDSQQEAEEKLRSGEIDILSYCVDEREATESQDLVVLDEYAQIPLVLVMRKDKNFEDIKTAATVAELESEIAKQLDNENVSFVVQDTVEECLTLINSGDADAVLCDGYLAEYLIGSEMKYSNLKITNVLNSEHSVHMVIRKDSTSALEGILKKSISNIDVKSINEYTLKETVYPMMGVKAFVEDHSIAIVLILVVVIIAIVVVATHIIRNNYKIQQLLYKDTVMDIWNLNYLIVRGEHRLLPERKAQYAVVCVNIVKLRRYNVIYGWDAGEELLEIARNTLQNCVDEKMEICARSYGDRFVLLLTWDNWDTFLKRLQGIQCVVRDAIFDRTENHMSLQLGVYPIPMNDSDLHDAVDCANQALEMISDDNANEIKVYDESFEAMLKERHEREKLLESVELEGNFVAYYQNKVDIRTNKIIGAEALVRFLDPTADGAVKSPFYFVPYYEQTGRIIEIDFYVMETVCKMLRRRMDAGKEIVPISCNFSRMHFARPGFPERFESILERYQISKELIEVEITETLVVEELQQQTVKETLDVLREKGIRLSIDDFGAGYSSLGVFEQIPASVVKLDRAFMLNQENHERQVKIMRGIVKLTDELGAQLVCEGVETEKDVELMNEIEAYVAQGYFYSKPVPEAEFEKKLDKQFAKKC